MVIPDSVREQLEAHAAAEAPNEACDSHPTDSARPSRTDVESVGLWASRPYVILSRPTGELAAWRIEDGRIEPLELRPVR